MSEGFFSRVVTSNPVQCHVRAYGTFPPANAGRNRVVRKGFTTLAVKGTHSRSFRAPASRVQPLTFDPLRAAPDRFTRILFQTLPFVLSDDSDR
jgi:hypothetical protein